MIYGNQLVKLIDCRTHGVNAGAELFIVEGDSAALAVTKLRDGKLQAVLPMQGKPLNTLKANAQKVAQNPLFKALIDAVGAGFGDDFDLKKVRYTRIVLLMDADADGIHCGALLMLFFYAWMRPLLESGAIFLARAPVGEIENCASNEKEYAYTEAAFLDLLEKVKANKNQQFNTLKYRGLAGVGNALGPLCIDVQTRKIMQLGIKDAEMAMAVFGGAHDLME